MASRETDKRLLLSAMLGSKDEILLRFFPSISDSYLDIDLENVVFENVKRSYYFVLLYVGDIKAAESTKSKPQSSMVKWEWKANNQM